MSSTAERPKVPGFPLPRIFKERDKLYDFLELHAGRVPEHGVFEKLCGALGAVYGLAPDSAPVFETVRSLPAEPLTRRQLWLFAWRVAANSQLLQRGHPVRAWSGQAVAEWVPFEILDARFERTNWGAGYGLTCRALAGSPAAELVSRFWSMGSLRPRLRLLGFTDRGRPTKKLPYQDHRQLVRLRFAGHVTPEASGESPGIAREADAPALLRWNKLVLKQRILREPPCPQQFKHPCHVCPVGYARGAVRCPAAVHQTTWEFRECPECREPAWFDPAAGRNICEECARRLRED